MSRKFHLLGCAAVVVMALPALASDTDWQQQALFAASAYAEANWPEQCEPLVSPLVSPLSFELQIGEDSAARSALMVQFPCRRSGESQSYLFFTSDQYGTVTLQSFPRPVLAVSTIIRFDTGVEIKDAVYDPGSRTVVEVAHDPDAHNVTMTEWMYFQGRFQITRFAVDATDDGRNNPQVLLEEQL